MFKKNIKIYSIVSLVLFLEVIIFSLAMQVGFDAFIIDLPKICAIVFPPIIIAYIFHLMSLKYTKDVAVKIFNVIKLLLNVIAVIYYLYWQYIILCIIIFIMLLYYDAKNYVIN